MKEYFCGWYFKCQSKEDTLALIPALHRSKEGRSASLQFITDNGAWKVDFPYEQLQKQKHSFSLSLGVCHFGEDGISLSLRTPDCHAEGKLVFGKITPIRYDIMGIFRYLPLMECRHSVVSMRHSINGNLTINRKTYSFRDAVGYIEGDRGRSFPSEYAWTQSFFEGGSLMLSVANIPWMGLSFTGVIAIVLWQGKEYRLATYLGAKLEKLAQGEIVIRQGALLLCARLIEKRAQDLSAPVCGKMSRTIRESAACRAAYAFSKDGKSLFSFESDNASFEYEYMQ